MFDVNDNCWLIDWYCVMFAGSWFADVVLFDVYWCVASLCNVLSVYVLWFTRCCLLATLAHSLQQRRTRIQVSILKSQRASVVFKSSIVTTSWNCYRASGRHGFQRINGWGCLLPWFPIHSGNTPWIHLSQCEICVIPSHCKPCKPCKPEELSLEKQKPRENCNLPFFSQQYALRRVHGRPPVPVLHLPQGALWPWRWMQMSVSYGGGSQTGHSDGWRHHTPMTRKQSEMVQNMQSKKKAHKLEEQIWFACVFM